MTQKQIAAKRQSVAKGGGVEKTRTTNDGQFMAMLTP